MSVINCIYIVEYQDNPFLRAVALRDAIDEYTKIKALGYLLHLYTQDNSMCALYLITMKGSYAENTNIFDKPCRRKQYYV